MEKKRNYKSVCFCFFLFFLHVPFVLGDSVSINEIDSVKDNYKQCNPAVISNGSNEGMIFSLNLKAVMANLSVMAASSSPPHLFGNASASSSSSSAGAGGTNVYGFFQCRGDLSVEQCKICVSDLVEGVQAAAFCPAGTIGASIQLDHCFLRYENYSTFLTADGSSSTTISSQCNDTLTQDRTFVPEVSSLFNSFIQKAPSNGGYIASSSSGDTYALAQCLGYLSPSACGICLQNLVYPWPCGAAIGGRFFAEACYGRYEIYPFYTPSIDSFLNTSTAGSNQWGMSSIKLGVTIGSASVFLLLLIFIIYLIRKKKSKRKGSNEEAETIKAALEQMAATFSLDELKTATQDFDAENKLGEGGFGAVYKGTLSNGHVVAIKRLFQNKKGKHCDEFMREVNVLMTVQHKNLIKWHGYCTDGLERLLVFEYIPNKSLDKFLFDKELGKKLDWESRVRIVLGIARGLAYLHEDSQLSIVHRDIKAGNILLDHDLNPKISDFGLARLCPLQQIGRVSIAGTLGYIAPEYVIGGQLTAKTDVFSFGVVTLEIISGRKNMEPQLSPPMQHLLAWAWAKYQQKQVLELVDPRVRSQIEDDEVVEDVLRIVHIALLCTQASAELRPTMSRVINILLASGSHFIPEQPTQPAFVTFGGGNNSNSNTNRSAMVVTSATSISHSAREKKN